MCRWCRWTACVTCKPLRRPSWSRSSPICAVGRSSMTRSPRTHDGLWWRRWSPCLLGRCNGAGILQNLGMSSPVVSQSNPVCRLCTDFDPRSCGGSRQQPANTSTSENGESVRVMTSIVDRRPSWPLAPRTHRKHVSSTAISSGARQQRPWPAIRQPGISMAPKLAPANGSSVSCQGAAPAEARPPERQLQTQPQQSGHQPARLPSPGADLAKHREDQTSAEAKPAVETISRQRPKPAQDVPVELALIDPRAAHRTSLAQHIAAHGPPKLIFFDLETTGAAPSFRVSFNTRPKPVF